MRNQSLSSSSPLKANLESLLWSGKIPMGRQESFRIIVANQSSDMICNTINLRVSILNLFQCTISTMLFLKYSFLLSLSDCLSMATHAAMKWLMCGPSALWHQRLHLWLGGVRTSLVSPSLQRSSFSSSGHIGLLYKASVGAQMFSIWLMNRRESLQASFQP